MAITVLIIIVVVLIILYCLSYLNLLWKCANTTETIRKKEMRLYSVIFVIFTYTLS